MNHELPDVQAGYRKGRGIKDQIANIRWIMEKAREFHKKIFTKKKKDYSSCYVDDGLERGPVEVGRPDGNYCSRSLS